jgi:peptidoglycan/xylan/chitin deacetylase (PgdA/CDA1 family)
MYQRYAVATWNVDSFDYAGGNSIFENMKTRVEDLMELGQESFVILLHDTHFVEGLYTRIKEELFDDTFEFVKASDCYSSCNQRFCASETGYSIWQ